LLILSCRKGSESTGPSNPPVNSPARSYGGFANDVPAFAQKTSDGGFIIVGYTESFGAGNSDILLIKTDGYGNIQWAKTYGGVGYEKAYSVQQTSDGGYIILGYISSSGTGGYEDILLIKTDGNGNVKWAKTYGGTGSQKAYSVQQASDGGYIIAGYTAPWSIGGNAILIKTDANGNIQWGKKYEITNRTTRGKYAIQTNDGGFIFVVYLTSITTPGYIPILVKTNAYGETQWSKIIYEIISPDYDHSNYIVSLQKTSDGGYVLLLGGLLIKTNANGDIQWAKKYSIDNTYSLQQTSDGGFIIGGGEFSSYLIKTDANGNIQWSKTYASLGEGSRFVYQTNDNGFMIVSPIWVPVDSTDFQTDILLIKTDANGNVNSCPIVQDGNPNVNSLSLNVSNFNFDYSYPSSLNSSNISLTTTNLNLTPQDKCPAQ
jgi:hypothetical protein